MSAPRGPAALLGIGAAFAAFAALAASLVWRQAAAQPFRLASSLSTSATGASGFFDGLSALGYRVERGTQPFAFSALPGPGDTAFVLAPDALPPNQIPDLLAFVRQGGRLILSGPLPGLPGIPTPGKRPPRPSTPAALAAAIARVSWRDLNLRAVYFTPAPAVGVFPGMGPIPFQPALAFRPGHAWRVRVTSARGDLVVERRLGRGTFILLSDPRPLTNQVLRQAAGGHAFAAAIPFARWLTGGRRTIFVDETVHQVSAAPGLLWLLGRYGLLPALFAILICFALWIWRQLANPLAPMDDATIAPAPVFDRLEAPTRILQRAIAPDALMDMLAQAAAARRCPEQSGHPPPASEFRPQRDHRERGSMKIRTGRSSGRGRAATQGDLIG